jgi:hypothetical protein
MPLRSEFFKGDRALENCLVMDSAHVLLGATGDHVNKIQMALLVLDNASVAARELNTKVYGQSTAAAVLAYKTKRRIINFSYQKQADNIVGKMTIARLDQEMFTREQRNLGRPSCGDEICDGGGAGLESRASLNVSRLGITDSQDQIIRNQFSRKTLAIHWQRTAHSASAAASSTLFSLLVQKAIALLMPFNMQMSSNANALTETIPHSGVVGVNHSSADVVRRVAEQISRPNPNSLRVIVCPFPDGDPAFAFTSGKGFDPTFQSSVENYILINANKSRDDRCTLIHEMIHAATNLGEDRHDADNKGSVFSVESNRSLLKPEHALALSKAFFTS